MNQFIFMHLHPTAALEQSTLDLAIATYESKTCLKFKVRTNERDYVSVQKTGGGYK